MSWGVGMDIRGGGVKEMCGLCGRGSRGVRCRGGHLGGVDVQGVCGLVDGGGAGI